MSDRFDAFLADALGPPPRDADRAFVGRVQARIALERRLEAQRRAFVGKFVRELLGLVAVAAGLVLIGRSPDVAEFVAESPAVALAVAAALFSFLVLLFSRKSDGWSGDRSHTSAFQPLSSFTILND